MADKKNTTPPRAIVVIYDGFDMLDISGPFAFMSAGGLNPVLAGLEKTTYTSGQGVDFVSQKSFAELDMLLQGDYILWIPGGFGDDFASQFSKKNPLLQWLAAAGKNAKMVCPVCTGALIAAAAGLLNGSQVTTHWAFKNSLALFDVKLVPGFPRYHYDKKHRVLTGGGVSSGLDESLELIAMLSGKDMAMHAQLINQYAPQPPFNAGTPATAPKTVYKNIVSELQDGIDALNNLITEFLKK